jgi:hypothetical protein
MEFSKDLIRKNSSTSMQEKIFRLSWLLLVIFTYQTTACQDKKRDLAQVKNVEFI